MKSNEIDMQIKMHLLNLQRISMMMIIPTLRKKSCKCSYVWNERTTDDESEEESKPKLKRLLRLKWKMM